MSYQQIKNQLIESFQQDSLKDQQNILEDKYKFDPYRIPENKEEAIKQAKNYAKSLKVQKILQNSKICPYSGKYCEREQMSIFCDNIDLNFLGSGYPMYFEFLKGCMIILFMLFATSGAFNFFSNYYFGQDCKSMEEIQRLIDIDEDHQIDQMCQLTWTTKMSYANKISDSKLIFLQDIMNFISVFTIILVFQNIRTTQRAINEECDQYLISVGDYGVWIQDIPEYNQNQSTLKQSIKDDLQQQLAKNYNNLGQGIKYPEHHMEIAQISVCYHLNQINQVFNKQNSLLKKLGTVNERKQKENIYLIQNLLDSIKQEIIQQKQQYFEGKNFKLFNGHAFICFQREQDKEEVIANQFAGNPKALKLNGNYVKIQYAPEPENINWEALSFNSNSQNRRRLASLLITLLLLFSSFIIIYFIMNLQLNFKEQPPFPMEGYRMKMLAFAISITIQILNFLFQKILNQLAKYEKHYTKTEELSSLAKKLAFFQFINTAIITLLIKVLQYYFEDYQKAISNIYINGGLIYNQQYVFLMSLFFPFLQLLDFGYYYKLIRRNFVNIDKFTQAQLNQLYEEPEHNIAYDYGSIIKTMYVTVFYAPLIPIGIIMSIFSLFVTYFIHKYKLLNHRSVKYSISESISQDMIEQLEYLLPFYCISNALFQYLLIPGQNISYFAYAGIIISVIHVYLPMKKLNEFFFHVRKAPDLRETYDDNLFNFQFDYDRANPATDQFGTIQLLKKQKSKKIIPQFSHSESINYLNQ